MIEPLLGMIMPWNVALEPEVSNVKTSGSSESGTSILTSGSALTTDLRGRPRPRVGAGEASGVATIHRSATDIMQDMHTYHSRAPPKRLPTTVCLEEPYWIRSETVRQNGRKVRSPYPSLLLPGKEVLEVVSGRHDPSLSLKRVMQPLYAVVKARLELFKPIDRCISGDDLPYFALQGARICHKFRYEISTFLRQ